MWKGHQGPKKKGPRTRIPRSLATQPYERCSRETATGTSGRQALQQKPSNRNRLLWYCIATAVEAKCTSGHDHIRTTGAFLHAACFDCANIGHTANVCRSPPLVQQPAASPPQQQQPQPQAAKPQQPPQQGPQYTSWMQTNAVPQATATAAASLRNTSLEIYSVRGRACQHDSKRLPVLPCSTGLGQGGPTGCI